MKLTIEFNMPEDRVEFERMHHGSRALVALDNIREHLRGRLKYEELSPDVRTALEAVADFVHSEFEDVARPELDG